ncbi:L,D-transpeptidase [Salegentibacter chungangensis]|uniref:L,D-transpeptidase n=1 Tax=Salegentibacter chungangensis TaxID=1335724 RepID=A0ABW3NVR5_9FLAO
MAGGIFLTAFTTSCTTQLEGPAQPDIKNEQLKDSVKEAFRLEKAEPKKMRPKVNYRIDSLLTKAKIDSFNNRYSEENRKIIYALNRIDKHRVRPNTSLVIPDTLSNDLMTYSPFPEELEILDSLPQAVLIAQRIQAFALYENGELIKWGPVSSGKRTTQTPNGLHYANYKAKRKVSSVNDSWILPYYFNFMNFEGVGTHQYALPGYPASHACVRMYMDDAKFIYNWAKMWEIERGQIKKNGTPFMVFGSYDFENMKPWQKLPEDMKANDLNDEELETLKDYVKQYLDDPKNFREEPEAVEDAEMIV